MTNERIRELSKQAGQGDMFSVPPKFIDSFARLIVAECVEVCHKMAEDSDSYVVHDGDTCAEQIREHFGVK